MAKKSEDLHEKADKEREEAEVAERDYNAAKAEELREEADEYEEKSKK